MTPTLTAFVRRQAVTYTAFIAVSAVAVALSRRTDPETPLQTPGKLALAVSLMVAGSLAVVLAEQCLDHVLSARGEDSRAAASFLVVGIGTLTVAILVFYTAVYV